MKQKISSYAKYQSTNEEIQGLTEQSKKYSEVIRGVLDEVENVIVGQEKIVSKIVIAMMADGHVLLEGVQGLA